MLDLSRKKLTAEDMKIVAYYALQENEVSVSVFYVIIRKSNRSFVQMILPYQAYKVE